MSIDTTTPTPTSSSQQQQQQLQPQSRKAKRRSRNHSREKSSHDGNDHHAITNTNTNTNLIATGPPPSPSLQLSRMAAPVATASSTPVHLLICSIGNPSPYTNTLHSAAHTVLAALAASLPHPPFHRSRPHGGGFLSVGPKYSLYQSPDPMNISGPAVSSAWRAFLSSPHRNDAPALVVLHDELELPLGVVRTRPGVNSPKGHNGLKSIHSKMPGVPYTRIGIGIGRPASREPDVVAAYVLRKMTGEERRRIEACVGDVERELRKFRGELE